MVLLFRLPWPLPALLAWAGAWGAWWLLGRVLPGAVALPIACALPAVLSLWAGPVWRRLPVALGFPVALALSGAVPVPPWLWLLPLALLLLAYPMGAWRGAPWFPTPPGALDALATAAPMAAGAGVLDAGCGLGHGLRALRRAYPQARLEGWERSALLRLLCALRCPWARVRQADIWRGDWSAFALVYLFQRPESMAPAWDKALREMAPGSWLVSLEFAVPDTVPSGQLRLPNGRVVWIYRVERAGRPAHAKETS